MKPTCRWVPGTRNSLCDRDDVPLVGDDGEVRCELCLGIEAGLEEARRLPMGSMPHVDRRDVRGPAWTPGPYEGELPEIPSYALPTRAERRTRWLITLDEWYPNYNIGFIQASLGKSASGDTYYVSVWGGDDHGCGIHGLTEERARRVFEGLPVLIDMQTLLDLGFEF